MQYGVYLSGAGAQAQSRRLEVIANNLANVDTVGFKRDVPHFQARFAEAIQIGQAKSGDRSINDVGGGVKVIDVQTDFAAGRLQRTGKDFDLAIIGNGFFQLEGTDGAPLITRAGDLALDTQGRLVSQADNTPVLDQSGSPILLSREIPWSLTPDGRILQGGEERLLGLVQPESVDDLEKVGHNRFRAREGVEPVPVSEREVRQGYLENSGANPTRQMMAMIETTRAFEANTRMIQNHDSMTSTLIGRVLHA